MKKSFFSFISLAAIVAVAIVSSSCNGSKASDQTEENADSAKVEFLSDDLSFFGLQGQVKTVTETFKFGADYDPETAVFEFDEQGKLLTVNGKDVFEKQVDEESGTSTWWERDSEGRISATRLFAMSDGEEPIAGNRYEWGEKRVKSEKQISFFEGSIVANLTYLYDEGDVKIISKDGTIERPGMETEQVYHKYTYNSFDEKGNWTSRTEKTNDTGESGEVEFEYTETREIVYY